MEKGRKVALRNLFIAVLQISFPDRRFLRMAWFSDSYDMQ